MLCFSKAIAHTFIWIRNFAGIPCEGERVEKSQAKLRSLVEITTLMPHFNVVFVISICNIFFHLLHSRPTTSLPTEWDFNINRLLSTCKHTKKLKIDHFTVWVSLEELLEIIRSECTLEWLKKRKNGTEDLVHLLACFWWKLPANVNANFIWWRRRRRSKSCYDETNSLLAHHETNMFA